MKSLLFNSLQSTQENRSQCEGIISISNGKYSGGLCTGHYGTSSDKGHLAILGDQERLPRGGDGFPSPKQLVTLAMWRSPRRKDIEKRLENQLMQRSRS